MIRQTRSGWLARGTAAGALAAAGLAVAAVVSPAASAGPAAESAAAAAPAWRMQAPPEPAGTIQQAFGTVSCSSASACMAVAINAYPNSTDLGTFAESWNGSHWAVRKVPNGRNDASLNGVSCRSARWCVAVGVIKAVPPMGDNFVPVADRWNGQTWTQTRPPSGATTGNLAAVACSGTSACTAVGSSVKGGDAPRPLADRWNGSSWKVQAVPAPPAAGGALAAVACPAARACRAVGSDLTGLFSEIWNGSSWVTRPVPVPGGGSFAGLDGISCTTADFCEAVGSYQKGGTFVPLAEVWNGSRWRAQAPPTVSGWPQAALDAVSCLSATDCEAAGDAGVRSGPQETGVVEKWNGHAWSVQKTVRPAGDVAARLNGISCTTGPVCETTGWHEKAIPNSGVLALRYSR